MGQASDQLPGVPTPWQPDPSEPVRLDRAEMLRYLGHTGQAIDAELEERLARAVKTAEHAARPRGVFAVFPVEIADSDKTSAGQPSAARPDALAADGSSAGTLGSEPLIRLGGTAVELCGRDIFRHLKDAPWAALMACTLGHESERLLHAVGGRSALDAALLDAACSALVEATAETLDAHIQRLARDAGLSTTWRFSPGYGDLPLAAQRPVLAALNASRLCGITLTPSLLLMPTKSITAVVGIFDGKRPHDEAAPGCQSCRLRAACPRRARGARCFRT